YPLPINVLQVAFLARAHEADRRHIGLFAVVECEFPAPTASIKVLPPHQPPPSRRPGADCRSFNLFAHEPAWEDRRGHPTRQIVGSAIADWGRSQRQAFRFSEPTLCSEQLLQAHSKSLLRNRLKCISSHVPQF